MQSHDTQIVTLACFWLPRCGVHICWRCMGTFIDGIIYKHMTEAHRGYYDSELILLRGIDVLERRQLKQQIQCSREGEQERNGEGQEEQARER
ncbi:hypothetical protein EDD16DRAFT_1594982 [Pisolithus croceorrhizus]|nr:hypothetical protein EDD16DRAFT_1594982 [Pisolithus croceorrhizus]KAI6150017.1 hypothetical protein EDD17DRAFT_1641756 [Pisolithus thermaeus]